MPVNCLLSLWLVLLKKNKPPLSMVNTLFWFNRILASGNTLLVWSVWWPGWKPQCKSKKYFYRRFNVVCCTDRAGGASLENPVLLGQAKHSYSPGRMSLDDLTIPWTVPFISALRTALTQIIGQDDNCTSLPIISSIYFYRSIFALMPLKRWGT